MDNFFEDVTYISITKGSYDYVMDTYQDLETSFTTRAPIYKQSRDDLFNDLAKINQQIQEENFICMINNQAFLDNSITPKLEDAVEILGVRYSIDRIKDVPKHFVHVITLSSPL